MAYPLGNGSQLHGKRADTIVADDIIDAYGYGIRDLLNRKNEWHNSLKELLVENMNMANAPNVITSQQMYDEITKYGDVAQKVVVRKYPDYKTIANINVNAHTEKKNGLTYLSWSWALDQLYRLDEEAEFSYGETKVFEDKTQMVYCTVRAFGRSRTAHLPVMDFRNKPIASPDSMQVNTAMQRCLAKAIALHGLGLYIYSGEDLPPEEAATIKAKDEEIQKQSVKDEEILVKVTAKAIAMSEIMIPDTITDEAACVDYIFQFMSEWIVTVDDIKELREFWKVNKSALSRVEKFSKPKFDTLESAFKQKAIMLKKAKEEPEAV